jgi:hypothetical protein
MKTMHIDAFDPLDESKPREQLLQELSELRSQLVTRKRAEETLEETVARWTARDVL